MSSLTLSRHPYCRRMSNEKSAPHEYRHVRPFLDESHVTVVVCINSIDSMHQLPSVHRLNAIRQFFARFEWDSRVMSIGISLTSFTAHRIGSLWTCWEGENASWAMTSRSRRAFLLLNLYWWLSFYSELCNISRWLLVKVVLLWRLIPSDILTLVKTGDFSRFQLVCGRRTNGHILLQ